MFSIYLLQIKQPQASLEKHPISSFSLNLHGSLKEIKLKELETLLLEQHYPERIIKAGINKDLKIPQNELRNVKEQEKKKILPFISTLNPNNLKALPIIKETLENLKLRIV